MHATLSREKPTKVRRDKYGPLPPTRPDVETINYDLGHYRIWSESDPTQDYTVHLALRGKGEDTCTCKGYEFTGHCKDAPAVRNHRRRQEREQSERLAALLEGTAPASLYDLDSAPGYREYTSYGAGGAA